MLQLVPIYIFLAYAVTGLINNSLVFYTSRDQDLVRTAELLIARNMFFLGVGLLIYARFYRAKRARARTRSHTIHVVF